MSTTESHKLKSVDEFLRGEEASDIRLSQQGQERLHHLDVSVTCELESPSDTFQQKPILISEVVAPGTRHRESDQWNRSVHTEPEFEFAFSEFDATLNLQNAYKGVEV